MAIALSQKKDALFTGRLFVYHTHEPMYHVSTKIKPAIGSWSVLCPLFLIAHFLSEPTKLSNNLLLVNGHRTKYVNKYQQILQILLSQSNWLDKINKNC
jgi:hypothetical protein